MALPKITGPNTQVHTVVPVVFPTVTVELKVVYVPGQVMADIDETGRLVNWQRLIDERASKVAALISKGATPSEADGQVPQVENVPTLRDDIAVDMIAAGVAGVRTAGPAGESDGLGDIADPEPWGEFTRDDAVEIWETWPVWAKHHVYASVRAFSQTGATDPKAR